MGCYIYPRNTSTIEDVAAAIMDWNYRSELLVAGDINADLKYTGGKLWLEDILDKLAAAGLLDTHFLPRHKPWLTDRCTWRMQQDRKDVHARTEYILGTYHRLFQDVAVQYT